MLARKLNSPSKLEGEAASAAGEYVIPLRRFATPPLSQGRSLADCGCKSAKPRRGVRRAPFANHRSFSSRAPAASPRVLQSSAPRPTKLGPASYKRDPQGPFCWDGGRNPLGRGEKSVGTGGEIRWDAGRFPVRPWSVGETSPVPQKFFPRPPHRISVGTDPAVLSRKKQPPPLQEVVNTQHTRKEIGCYAMRLRRRPRRAAPTSINSPLVGSGTNLKLEAAKDAVQLALNFAAEVSSI